MKIEELEILRKSTQENVLENFKNASDEAINFIISERTTKYGEFIYINALKEQNNRKNSFERKIITISKSARNWAFISVLVSLIMFIIQFYSSK